VPAGDAVRSAFRTTPNATSTVLDDIETISAAAVCSNRFIGVPGGAAILHFSSWLEAGMGHGMVLELSTGLTLRELCTNSLA
jgi:hypothetical protein